jgi:hypothetical protein
MIDSKQQHGLYKLCLNDWTAHDNKRFVGKDRRPLPDRPYITAKLKILKVGQEAFAEQKSAEAQDERQQIAADQQSVINQAPPPSQAEGVLGVSILNPDSALGRLVLLDNSGRTIKQSPLNTVNARTLALISSRIFAIAGTNQGSGAIRLVEINANTLEMQKQGYDDITPQSLLWINGQELYALARSDGNINLVRFDTDLILQARSSINVHPFASVLFNDGNIITQRGDGSAVLLNPRDLSEK